MSSQAVTLDRAMREMLLPFLQTLQASAPAEAQVDALLYIYMYYINI